MKTCSRCLKSKTSDAFYKDKSKKDGMTSYCKICRKEYHSEYYSNNKEHILDSVKAWVSKNKTKRKAYRKLHYLNNRGTYHAKTRTRQAAKLKAIPAWADLDQIKRIYTACASISERTGVEHHVDHIIPLQGKTVCGLHVENNLAIIPAQMNLQKSNTYNTWDTK